MTPSSSTLYAYEVIRCDRNSDGDCSGAVSAVFASPNQDAAFAAAKREFDQLIKDDPEFCALKNGTLDVSYAAYNWQAKDQGYEGNYLFDDKIMLFTGSEDGEMQFSSMYIQARTCEYLAG